MGSQRDADKDTPGSASPAEGIERREHRRVDVTWAVDCHDGDTFLYSYIKNISAMGIFISTRRPPALNTRLTLKFMPDTVTERPFELEGEVAWINQWRENGENLNPGFGVRFVNLTPDMRERLVSLVHAIAYLDGE